MKHNIQHADPNDPHAQQYDDLLDLIAAAFACYTRTYLRENQMFQEIAMLFDTLAQQLDLPCTADVAAWYPFPRPDDHPCVPLIDTDAPLPSDFLDALDPNAPIPFSITPEGESEAEIADDPDLTCTPTDIGPTYVLSDPPPYLN